MLKLNSLGIGTLHRPYIISEIAQAHDGSVGIAHSMIDAAKAAGVDAVKFQTHIASEESTSDDVFRKPFSYQDSSRFDYWKRMEFDVSHWVSLKKHAEDIGLVFLSSPFSVAAVTLLDRIGVPLWKVGSGEIANAELLDAVTATHKPILASTGLHSWTDIDNLVIRLKTANIDFALLQCTTEYPSLLVDVGINVLSEIKSRYHCLSGLSDHTGVLAPALLAMSHGADVIEVHATFDRSMFGPDSKASLTFTEISQLVTYRNQFQEILSNPVDKNFAADSRASLRSIFSRSLALKRTLPSGHILSFSDICLKKPGTGLQPSQLPSIVGKKLRRQVLGNVLLKLDDLEP